MGDDSGGEGLIKMLLDTSHRENKGAQSRQAPGHTTSGSGQSASSGSSSLEERLVALVQMDHSYAKPWRPDASNTLPTKGILLATSKDSSYVLTDDSEYLNVDEEPLKPVPQYDPQHARKMMTECEKFVSFANPDLEEDGDQGFEESIPKDGWTHQQKVLYTRMIRVLHQDRLSRLAHEGRDNEPILRRICVDKAAKRARFVLSSYPTLWDIKTAQWLHRVFTDYLPKPYLAAWLDILQTLRSKVPTLIDKILAPFLLKSSDDKIQEVAAKGLSLLLQRPWDPAAKAISKSKIEQLPGNPIILVAPPGPGDPQLMPKRMRLWNNQLGCLGKVIVINLPIPTGEAKLKTTVNQYLQQIVTSTLNKVRETKSGNPERRIILMGWGPGASIITHVASIEKVAGIVCLGFPSTTLAGARGELGDPLLQLNTPTLFVIGDKAANACSDDIEDFREKISVETGLIVVGSSDHNLRVSKRKKRLEGITQTMVDRNLMEEIRDFLANVLTVAGQGKSAPGALQLASKVGGGVDSSSRKIGMDILNSSQTSPRKSSGEFFNPTMVSPRKSGSPDIHSATSSPRKPGKVGHSEAGLIGGSPRKIIKPAALEEDSCENLVKNAGKARKRNSSSTSTESAGPTISKRTNVGGSQQNRGGRSRPSTGAATSRSQSAPKRPRKPKNATSGDLQTDQSSTISSISGAISEKPQHPSPGSGVSFPVNSTVGIGMINTQFPPGLLSISTPLPQSTLMGQPQTTQPPPTIRLSPPELRFQAPTPPLVEGTALRPDIAVASVVSTMQLTSPTNTHPTIINRIHGVPVTCSSPTLARFPSQMHQRNNVTSPTKMGQLRQPLTLGGLQQRTTLPGIRPPVTKPTYSTISITLPIPVNPLSAHGVVSSSQIRSPSTASSQIVRTPTIQSNFRPTAVVGSQRIRAPSVASSRPAVVPGNTGVRQMTGIRHTSAGHSPLVVSPDGSGTIVNVSNASSNATVFPSGRFTSPVPTCQLQNVSRSIPSPSMPGIPSQFVAKKSQHLYSTGSASAVVKSVSIASSHGASSSQSTSSSQSHKKTVSEKQALQGVRKEDVPTEIKTDKSTKLHVEDQKSDTNTEIEDVAQILASLSGCVSK